MKLSRSLATLALIVTSLVATADQPSEITIEAPQSLAGVAARIREIDRETIVRSLEHAGLEMPPAITITLVDSGDPASRRLPPWVVGEAFGGNAITIYPQRVGAYPYDSLESVIIHEVAHLALFQRAGGRPLPRWFHEGVAIAVESGWGLGSQLRLLVAAQQDPGIDDVSRLFTSETQPATTTAYLLSAALIEDTRRRHGATVPGQIAMRVAAGVSFERAFVEVTGESADEAAAHAWRVYRGLRWLPVLTSPSGVWTVILALAAVAFVIRIRQRQLKRRAWESEEHDDIQHRFDARDPRA